MIASHKGKVVSLLLDALKAKTTVSYSQFYKLFDDLSPKEFGGENLFKADIHRTLEAAGEKLADLSDAIVTCVMRNKDDIPGIGFFDVYRNRRPVEYEAVAGETILQRLSIDQKREMLKLERLRTYEYADRYL